MEPLTATGPQELDSDESEEEPTLVAHDRIDPATRQRIDEERERAQQELDEALQSTDVARLRAAVTRGRRFRLNGLEDAAKALRKAEKKATKQHKAEKLRGDGRSAPAAAAPRPQEGNKKESMKHFYVEKQRKSMCRMHALNAFFQRPKLNEHGFMQLCCDFEKTTGASRGSSEYFYVESGGANILSFVVERDRRYRTVYFPPGTQADIDQFGEEEIVGYFEFDSGHVWYVLRDRQRWVVLDSRTGVPERVKGTGLRREFGQIFVLRIPQDAEAAVAARSAPRIGNDVEP